MRQWLSSSLEQDDYLLLEARTTGEVLHFARFHSRQIQVLLAQDHLLDNALTDLLAHLRPNLQIVIIQDEDGQSGLPAARALDRVRQLLQRFQQIAISR